MKWNTAYHIYEGFALVVIILSWWMYVTDQVIDNETHWQSFNYSLEISLQKASIAAQEADSTLCVDVKKNGNSREGLDRIKRVALLQKRTNATINNLEKAKNHLRGLSHSDQTQVRDWMIRYKTAYHIKDTLDQYVDWLREEFRDLQLPKFEKIANGNEENALYFVWEPDRDFTHNYFEYTTSNAAMTILTQKQLVVKRYEAEILRKLGAGDISFGCHWYWIEASAFAPSQTIQVGDEYTADMFIKGSASKSNPRMTYNEVPIAVKDGKGDIWFRAYSPGKQSWKGSITFRNNRKDTTFSRRVSFTVLPPSKTVATEKK